MTDEEKIAELEPLCDELMAWAAAKEAEGWDAQQALSAIVLLGCAIIEERKIARGEALQ
jgi:hypothetical protein